MILKYPPKKVVTYLDLASPSAINLAELKSFQFKDGLFLTKYYLSNCSSAIRLLIELFIKLQQTHHSINMNRILNQRIVSTIYLG